MTVAETPPDGVRELVRRPMTGRQRVWILLAILGVVALAAALWGMPGRHKRPDTTPEHGISAGLPYSVPIEPAPVVKPRPTPITALSMPKPFPTAAAPGKDSALEAPIFSSSTGEEGKGGGKTAHVGDGEDGSNTRDDEFSNELKVSDVGAKARAKKMRHPELTVPAGVVIPCILQTAINSQLAGFVDCVLPADVRSADGTVSLLDKGTTVIGQIRSGIRRGQDRLFILWSRARTPDNITVELASPAADELGRAGVDGYVNDHFWRMLLHSLLFSVIEYGPTLGATALQNQNNSNISNYTTFLTPQQSLAQTVLQDELRIPPTLEKNQGDLVSIFVARDLDFSSVYNLLVRR